jgi:type IV secretory pathway VirB4 component
VTRSWVTPPPHRATSAQLQALYPFVAEGGLGAGGAYVGRDLLGGAFAFDPWELYARGRLTSPNMLVIGSIGRGKSSLVKGWLWRELVFGRRAWVVDPKGEYGALAAACGVSPVRLAPGGSIRLNPLDPGPAPDGDRLRRQGELLASLAAASLGRSLAPRERTAVELALGALDSPARRTPPTLPAVVEALLAPDEQTAALVHADALTLAADGREVALELRRLVEGDLRGMFDGPTTAGIDLTAPVVVLDLSAVYSSAALGMFIICATAWLQAALVAEAGVRRIVVVDEAWAVLSDLAIARWLRSSCKLSRAIGVANVIVLHRVSDLAAAGGEGSEQVRLAQGLLADAETRVIYGQPPGEVAAARELLGLTSTEADLLTRLPRGVALWKVGTRSFLVEHRLAPSERHLVDTDSRMGAVSGCPQPT